MHFKMCIKVMIPLRTSFKREHFIFYKLSDFLCFGSFFLFFSPSFLLVVQFTQRPRVRETWEEEGGGGREQNNQSEEIRF